MGEVREKGIVASKTNPNELIVEPLPDWFLDGLNEGFKRDKVIKKIKKLLKKL